MKRLKLSFYTLAAIAHGLAALATPASAEISSECQGFAEDFSEYYVTKRANVHEVPNMDGRIHATLPAGSTIYTNEYLRDTSFNPEKWYLLLPSKSLPPISGCIAGFIHPSLVSTTPPSTQQAEQPKGGDQQRGDMSGDKGALWGAIVLSAHWGDYSNDKNYAVAWNYPSQSTAIEAAIDRCASRNLRGDCGRNGVYYSRENGYASHVAFSSATQRHDSILDSDDSNNPGTSYLGAALASKHMGISAVVRHKCVLVWSELETKTDPMEGDPSIPLAVFAATETKARTAFSTYWSKSPVVSGSWRDELKVYCNDH